MSYLTEAFQRLNLLTEDDFDLSIDKDKVDELKSFVADDIDVIDEEPIIDVEAETDDDLKDNYIGKVIVECECCHSRLYKEISDVVIDDESGLANIEEECPVCGTTSGYAVIGKIEEFNKDAKFETEDEKEPEEVEEPKETEEHEEDEDEIDAEITEALRQVLGEGEHCHSNDFEPNDRDFEDHEEDEVDESLKNSKLASEDSKKLDEEKEICPECGEVIDDEHPMCDDCKEKAAEKEKVEEACKDCLDEAYAQEIDWAADDDDLSTEEAVIASVKEAGLPDGVKVTVLDLEGPGGGWPEIRLTGPKDLVDGFLRETGFEDLLDDEDLDESVKAKDESLQKVELASEDSKKLDEEKECDDCEDKEDCEDCKEEKCDEACKNESLTEEVHDVEVKTENGDVEVSKDGDKVTVDFAPAGEEAPVEPTGEEMIAPLNDEEVAEIEANDPEADIDADVEDDLGLDAAPEEAEISVEDELGLEDEEEAEEEEDLLGADEFKEELFDYLGNSYLKKIYENVNSFKTTNVKVEDNQLVVEGLIKFESGKEKKTTFMFEKTMISKRGKTILEGKNETFSNSNKAFRLKGDVVDGVFVCEALTYNYTAKQLNESNGEETVKVYGRAEVE